MFISTSLVYFTAHWSTTSSSTAVNEHSGGGEISLIYSAKLQGILANYENNTLNTSFAQFPSAVLYILHDSFNSVFIPSLFCFFSSIFSILF